MRRRIIALVAALLLAGVGTFVLVGFVRGAADRATAGEELAAVYIIKSQIPQGTDGASIGRFVALEEVPVKIRASDAVTDLNDLAEFVANVDLVPGEQLLASRFVAPTELDARRDDLPSRRIEVPEGKLELPIRFTTEAALGGIIDAGDTVAIVASFSNYSGPLSDTVDLDGTIIAIPESIVDEGAGSATHILVHNALVVEVQADTAPVFAQGETDEGGVPSEALLAPATSFVVTFALDPIDVERAVFAAVNGELWLAAQTPDDTGPTKIITMPEIFED